MQPGSRNQRPNLLTSLMNMSLVQRLPREMHLCRSSTNLPNLPSFLEILQNPHVLLTFGEVQNPVPVAPATQNHIWTFKSGPSMCFFLVCFYTFWLWSVLRATTACTFSTSQLPKVVRAWCALHILTWKCASHHNCMHFFDISTSKSGPDLVCFVHFDFKMCFASQRLALQNVLRVTTACTFSTSQLPKVVRAWCALHILTWKCASHHNCMHFFDIATSKSAPNLV